jgi:uncharacterized membrane protein
MLKKISLYVMSLFYVIAGFNHFMNPELYLKMIPKILPSPTALNVISGALEMAFGMMLMRPEVRSLAAWCLILLLIAVFPANVSMYLEGGATFNLPDWALLLRLPLQFVLIAWAFWHTKNPEIDTAIIETEILISAPPEVVWRELNDFSRYAEWNPFIVRVRGEGRFGARLEMSIKPPGSDEFQFRNTVTEYEALRRLAWKGSFIFRGLFDGTHYFKIEPQAGGTLFTQGEKFEGVFVCALLGFLENTRRGFMEMNQALKARCESQV